MPIISLLPPNNISAGVITCPSVVPPEVYGHVKAGRREARVCILIAMLTHTDFIDGTY